VGRKFRKFRNKEFFGGFRGYLRFSANLRTIVAATEYRRAYLAVARAATALAANIADLLTWPSYEPASILS